jgi:hypothetical protein
LPLSLVQEKRKKRSDLPPVTPKTYSEPNLDNVTFSVIKLQTIPSVAKPLKTKADQKPTPTISFLMIKEKEFPHLFEDDVSKHQKMSKYFDEQDFNSDCELIERNKGDLLKNLFQAIGRYTKSDPTKFVENLKSPAHDVDVSTLEKRVNKIKEGLITPNNESAAKAESIEASSPSRN